MNVRYIRLSDGEEVLAEFIEELHTVKLINPLQIDYGEVNDTKYAFLSRWNPFSDDNNVTIPKSHIYYHTGVKPETAEYYLLSLEYAETISDDIFTRRLLEAKSLIHNWSMPDPEDEADGLNPVSGRTFH